MTPSWFFWMFHSHFQAPWFSSATDSEESARLTRTTRATEDSRAGRGKGKGKKKMPFSSTSHKMCQKRAFSPQRGRRRGSRSEPTGRQDGRSGFSGEGPRGPGRPSVLRAGTARFLLIVAICLLGLLCVLSIAALVKRTEFILLSFHRFSVF